MHVFINKSVQGHAWPFFRFRKDREYSQNQLKQCGTLAMHIGSRITNIRGSGCTQTVWPNLGFSIATSKRSKYWEHIPTQTYPLKNRSYRKSRSTGNSTINKPFSIAMLNYQMAHKHWNSETLSLSRGHVPSALSQHQLGCWPNHVKPSKKKESHLGSSHLHWKDANKVVVSVPIITNQS